MTYFFFWICFGAGDAFFPLNKRSVARRRGFFSRGAGAGVFSRAQCEHNSAIARASRLSSLSLTRDPTRARRKAARGFHSLLLCNQNITGPQQKFCLRRLSSSALPSRRSRAARAALLMLLATLRAAPAVHSITTPNNQTAPPLALFFFLAALGVGAAADRQTDKSTTGATRGAVPHPPTLRGACAASEYPSALLPSSSSPPPTCPAPRSARLSSPSTLPG